MTAPPVLDALSLAYGPVFDRQRALIATRLSLFPARSEAAPAVSDAAAFLACLAEHFEPAPVAATVLPPVLLSVASETWLDAVLQAATRQPLGVLIEVPAFLAVPRTEAIRAAQAAGQAVGWGGWPLDEQPRAVAHDTRFAVAPVADMQQAVAAKARAPVLHPVVAGVRHAAEIEQAFAARAIGVAGWPVDDDIVYTKPSGIPPEVRGIVELMNRVEREEPPERLEAVLTADPTLAFRLLRYLNSSAFGLRAEVTSFRHGLMMLGHQRLKRWLALLLASGSSDPGARLLMAVAARRALVLEELVRASGADESMRSEMFICGVFSLLDRMLRQPMDDLMRALPVPQRVAQTLLDPHGGPYAPQLALVAALEQGTAHDVREASERALLARADINHALLRGLALARGLD